MKTVKEEMITCSDCGLLYVLPYDRREHNAFCARFQMARERFGPDKVVIGYQDREAQKRRGWDKVHGETLPLAERVAGAEMVLTAWFSRSVEAAVMGRYDGAHPDFAGYAAMMLHQGSMRESFGADVNEVLVKRYGTNPGIADDRSYWVPGDSGRQLKRGVI